MSIQVGIVGVSGYGGGEALRLIAAHPSFELVYVAGDSSAGARLIERFPGISPKLADLQIQKWDPATLPDLDVLLASLPTGKSREPLAAVSDKIKIVDIGGDHRYVDGWTYGLADVWPDQVRRATRIANPGCYPAAALTALAPLLAAKLIAPENIIIDAKTGVSGAGRGGTDARFGYAEVNEDLIAYGLLKHTHMPEIAATIAKISGTGAAGLVFTPHLCPMTRGILATIYCRASQPGHGPTTQDCLDAARQFYKNSPFVRVTDNPPHTKWATGSNLAFVSYAADPQRDLVMALGVVDNLGKGAAGQAIQNANLITGQDQTAGLQGMALWP
ncbi:MAG: N-acetyl-gamma-glutamyl-phosphate reductase [Phycisphaerales bacterium]|nr:N-acetyl-gamma-glutamyl-phosphate reductase [Phycisphaerales bacterium]